MHRALAQAASAEAPVSTGAGALEPETSGPDFDAQELQAAFAVLQRAFRPGRGRGEGGKPA
eukprot:11082936-Alexandrium_andersonii.AAC.1